MESRDTTEVKRLQAVRLYSSGTAVSDIMDVTGCTERSLRRWAQHYSEKGLTNLQPYYRKCSENASNLSAAQQADLQQQLHQWRKVLDSE